MTLFIPPPSAGNPIWANDHIWLDIQRPGGPQGTDEAEGTPPSTPGGPMGTLDNLINVVVDRTDHGVDANRVVVQAFVSNPSAGVGASTGNLASAGGQSGLQGPFPVPTSFATPQTIQIDWYPTDKDVLVNGGHICIAANVYDLGGDGTVLTSGPINLSDPHMAQRNISIVLAPAGLHAPVPFSFYIPEAELMPAGEREIVLQVEPVPAERVLTSVIREQLLASTTVTLVGGKPTPEANAPSPCLSEPRERIRLRGGGELVLARGNVPIHPANDPPPEVALVNQEQPAGSKGPVRIIPRPGRRLPVTAQFTMSPEARPGGVREFDIILQGSGEITGGIRVVVLTDAD